MKEKSLLKYMIHTIYLPRLCSDDDLKTMKGKYLDSEWILHQITKDTDVYDEETKQLVVSYRRKRLKKANIGLENFKCLAKASRGRGASAGPIDPNSKYWTKRTVIETNGFRTGYLKKDGTPSKMKVNNQVMSQAIGYFNEIKGLGVNIPCRLSHYTQVNLQKYVNGIPFIEEIDTWYKKLAPTHHRYQLDRACLKPHLKIGKSAFSTMTVNKNFRTALHKDSGDYGGYACLSVLQEGRYNGGIFMMPGYGIGIDLRQGDIIVADVHEYHCNTEIWTTESQDQHNATLNLKRDEGDGVGTIGANKPYSRISLVLYLREKMIECADA